MQKEIRNGTVNGGFTDIDPNSIWKINTQGMVLLPKALVYCILKHEGTHYGRDGSMDLIRLHLMSPICQGPFRGLYKPVKYVPKTILKQNTSQ